MTLKVGRKGDIITFGDDEYRLERVAIVNPEGTEAVNRELAPADAGEADDEPVPVLYRLYKRADTNGVHADPHKDGEEGPTSYTYRFDPIGEFEAIDDDAATTEAKRLIAEG